MINRLACPSGRVACVRVLWLWLSLSTAVQADTQAAPRFAVARPAMQTVHLTGFTRARHVVTLATEVAGKVERVWVDVGDALDQSGQLACLDTTFVQLDLKANQAELGRLSAEIDFYRKQLTRYRQLVLQQNSAPMQLDEAQRSLSTSQQQRARIRVERKRLLEKKRRHCITAQPGWRLIERRVEPGQWLAIGDPLATVGDFSRLLVPFAVSMPVFQALQKRAGLLELFLPDVDRTVTARIERVSPEFDPQSRKIQLDLAFQAQPGIDRGGLRVELQLQLPGRVGAILIEETALLRRYEEYWLRRATGQEVQVVYQGRAGVQSETGVELIQVTAPGVRAGERFQLQKP